MINNTEQTINQLIYKSYCYNRDIGLTPDDMIKLGFEDTEIYEYLYQHPEKQLFRGAEGIQ